MTKKNKAVGNAKRYLKKVSGVGKEVEPEVIIQLVEFYRGKITQKKVLETLNISRTTYNRWKKEIPNEKEDSNLVKLVKTLCAENKYRYGYRKLRIL